ncbi:MAG: hypothetical protein ABIQ56_07125, partial [Chitinophagaceae bacterium]
MKLLSIFVALLFPAILFAQPTGDVLVTTSSFGKVSRNTTFNELKKLYGAANCKDDIEYGPEGIDSFNVTRVYAGSSKEFIVFWEKKKFHKLVQAVECYARSAPYQTADGLKIGTTLDKLLKANGKKINFYGTGWDYGGMITSFNKGKYDGSTINFELSDRPGMSQKLMGDRE